MALSRPTILRFRESGIVVIEPFTHSHLGTNSYDLTLGPVVWVLVADKTYCGPFEAMDNRLYIMPNITILGHTQEQVGGHKYVYGEIRSRSTTRRGGVSIGSDALMGDVGYVLEWTVELTAHTRFPVRLTCGHRGRDEERFAQMLFHCTDKPVEKEYAGQYRSNRPFPERMLPKGALTVPADFLVEMGNVGETERMNIMPLTDETRRYWQERLG